MRKTYATANKMMEMCMWNCYLYINFRTQISDTLSISQWNHISQMNHLAA